MATSQFIFSYLFKNVISTYKRDPLQKYLTLDLTHHLVTRSKLTWAKRQHLLNV